MHTLAVAHQDQSVQLLDQLQAHAPGQLRHVHRLPERSATCVPWPDWVDPRVEAAFVGGGVTSLWRHQLQAAELAHGGEHVVISTGTASGKSLAYLVPGLSAVAAGADHVTGRAATMLYLAPTKALAADQLARIDGLAVPGVRAACYDGDTVADERAWIRDHSNVVLTNPDLLHHSMLPGHRRWSSFLRALRYVVIDECHVYRGVFGSQVAAVLRRLQRVTTRYGSTPTYVLSSATVGEPSELAERLTGLGCQAVTEDAAPRAAVTVALWEPGPLRDATAGLPSDAAGDAKAAEQDSAGDSGVAPQRRSATSEAADLLAELVRHGSQTVGFARSRAGVEALAARARQQLELDRPELAARVAAYRGGYLPEERRALESQLRERELMAVAATNALELGVDIAGLDAVIIAGWPGRRSSFWQQVGRAGRAGNEALAIFVAADDPLDSYLLAHPEMLLAAPIEAAVLDPTNPIVLAPQLAAAAAELPLTEADLDMFGPTASDVVAALTQRRILRRRPTGWFWARTDRPGDHVTLRGAGSVVTIAEGRSGRVIGTVDESSAHSQVHTGAVHLHQGAPYVVTDFDVEAATATVAAGDPGWSTIARSVSDFQIQRSERSLQLGSLEVHFGQVEVTGQVTSFVRRLPSGEIIGTHPLQLPQRRLATRGVWWTLPEAQLTELAGTVSAEDLPGALHAAEHAAIAMLPLVATSDRWDVGGVSTVLHPDTGAPTVLIYDGHPGGAGFAERGFEAIDQWLTATREAINSCPCAAGCPACIQSPKCGNGNEPLDKRGAVAVLDIVLGMIADNRPSASVGRGAPGRT